MGNTPNMQRPSDARPPSSSSCRRVYIFDQNCLSDAEAQILKCVVTSCNHSEVDVVEVYEMLKRGWYHYKEDCTDDREIIDMISKICALTLNLRTNIILRKVCKRWAKELKTSLDKVQSRIKSMDARVVMCYVFTMLRKYSFRPEYVPYNEYHPPNKHIPVIINREIWSRMLFGRYLLSGCVPIVQRDNRPILLIWKDSTPSWLLGLEALKKMGEDAQARATQKFPEMIPTVFEICIDSVTPPPSLAVYPWGAGPVCL